MKKITLMALALFLSCGTLALAQCPAHSCCPKASNLENMKMTPLFGDKLQNADFPEGVWSFNDQNVLVPTKDDVIWTKEKYGSFICSFEFNAPDGANSGFLLHCTDKSNWIPNTIEIQLLGDHGQETDYHHCGAFYGYQAPTENATRPAGEWNKMVVISMGRKIIIILNDKKINEIDLAQWTDRVKGPAGTEIEEKFQGKALADSEPYGYIGFQGLHGGDGITFRNAQIKRISEDLPEATELLFGEKLENAEYDPEVWSVDAEGVLHATRDEVIWSKEKYKAFIMDLEFKNSEESNSGVVINCSDKSQWIPNSLEVQVYDSFGQPIDHSSCAAIYGHCSPMLNSCKPKGEWNRLQILCVENRICVFLNGELSTVMNKALWTEKATNPDGTSVPEWLREHAPCELADEGYVGLQGLHEKSPVVYRNVKIGRIECPKDEK